MSDQAMSGNETVRLAIVVNCERGVIFAAEKLADAGGLKEREVCLLRLKAAVAALRRARVA